MRGDGCGPGTCTTDGASCSGGAEHSWTTVAPLPRGLVGAPGVTGTESGTGPLLPARAVTG